MYCVTVVYPKAGSTRFDLEYYQQTKTADDWQKYRSTGLNDKTSTGVLGIRLLVI